MRFLLRLPSLSSLFDTDCGHGSDAWHDDGNRVRTFFHGTDAEAAKKILRYGFKESSSGMLGPGVYMSTDLSKAQAYGNVILSLKVQCRKTKVIDCQGHYLQQSWHGKFNTAYVPAGRGVTPSGRTETCVRSANQVRAVKVYSGGHLL